MKEKTLREERTAAEMNRVVKTTRRRRRILQTGFYFIIGILPRVCSQTLFYIILSNVLTINE